jgi:hypothetical protein
VFGVPEHKLKSVLARSQFNVRLSLAGAEMKMSCVIRLKAATDSDAIRPPIPIEAGRPGEAGLKLSMSAIESRTRRPLQPCEGRSDARRESADAEGSRSSEIETRAGRE